jgi:hypothetical protein
MLTSTNSSGLSEKPSGTVQDHAIRLPKGAEMSCRASVTVTRPNMAEKARSRAERPHRVVFISVPDLGGAIQPQDR